MSFNRNELADLYKRESDPNVRERLLLVLKVKVDHIIPARVAKELRRSRTWLLIGLQDIQKKESKG
jgi:hypothetical protein